MSMSIKNLAKRVRNLDWVWIRVQCYFTAMICLAIYGAIFCGGMETAILCILAGLSIVFVCVLVEALFVKMMKILRRCHIPKIVNVVFLVMAIMAIKTRYTFNMLMVMEALVSFELVNEMTKE